MASDRRTWLAQGLTGLLAATALPRAGAQTAGKPIRLLVGYPPGGPNDILARLIAPRLGDALKQAVIVENRPGVAGTLASTEVARAVGDGQTLLLGSAGPNAISPAVYPNFPFDPIKDIAPISMVALVPNVLVVRPDLPANSLAELVALVRSKPGKLTFASSGSGSTLHLSGELFKQQAGLFMLHIPYRGTAPATQDVVAGNVDMIFAALPSVMPLVRAGRLRALAVTPARRSRAVPDLPTMSEAGAALGLARYDVTPWYGVFAPGATPPELQARLSAAVRQVVGEPAVAEQLAAQGAEPLSNTPAEFRALLQAEITKWAAVVKFANVKVD
jgi:tripartite-type tricarboxylate transporter receptor subunit TctC